jgi:hypothetical protein
MEKEGEPEAEEGDEYLFINFMMRTAGDKLQWPRRIDHLNVLKVDVLFCCQPPAPSPGTSSSRSIAYYLSKEELKKAKHLFRINMAFYPTRVTGTGILLVTFTLSMVRYRYCMYRKLCGGLVFACVCVSRYLPVWYGNVLYMCLHLLPYRNGKVLVLVR